MFSRKRCWDVARRGRRGPTPRVSVDGVDGVDGADSVDGVDGVDTHVLSSSLAERLDARHDGNDVGAVLVLCEEQRLGLLDPPIAPTLDTGAKFKQKTDRN